MILPRELTEEEYLGTMGGGMKNITDTAECLADIWGYASSISVRMLLSDYGYDNRLIEAVYENSEGTFQHILLFAIEVNTYAVIVVDVGKCEIFGHYYLDLNGRYGLDESG